jgi:hypothetical protein
MFRIRRIFLLVIGLGLIAGMVRAVIEALAQS